MIGRLVAVLALTAACRGSDDETASAGDEVGSAGSSAAAGARVAGNADSGSGAARGAIGSATGSAGSGNAGSGSAGSVAADGVMFGTADADVFAKPRVTPRPARDPHDLCTINVKRMMGMIRIRADKATQRGELEAFNASTAPSRDLFVVAHTDGPTITFVFDSYGVDDNTFRGKRVRRKTELKRGDVVARIVATGYERRLFFDGAFHLAEGFDPPHDGGYYVCE